MALSSDEIRAFFAPASDKPLADEKPQQSHAEPPSASFQHPAVTTEPIPLVEPRHRYPNPRPAHDNHAAPPHSVDAEKGILGSMLLDASKVVPEVMGQVSDSWFYVPAHATIFRVVCSMVEDREAIDLITVTQRVTDMGHLDKVGGPGAITELFTFVPFSGNVQYYIDIVRAKYISREMILAGTKLARLAQAEDEEVWDAIGKYETRVRELRALESDKLEGVENFSYESLVSFDTTKDTGALIGRNRYLGKGYTCMWAGGSGYGKSTLAMQCALYWATGAAVFGINAVRPLKSLIVQAENDLGDTSEQLQGVVAGIKASGDINLNGQVERMISVVRLIGCTGDSFLHRLRALIKLHQPDLVWVDPLFAFAGCDLIDTASVTKFMREGLIPVAVELGVCLHVIHHVSKPVRDNKDKASWSSFDMQFLGFGSSEIQNAFRAVNILVPVSKHDGMFRLVLSKRGSRAGALDTNKEPTTSIYLEHSKEGLLWLQVEKPEDVDVKQRRGGGDGKFQTKYSAQMILDQMSLVHGQTAGELKVILKDENEMSAKTFNRFWADLKADGLVRVDSERKWYLKNKNE